MGAMENITDSSSEFEEHLTVSSFHNKKLKSEDDHVEADTECEDWLNLAKAFHVKPIDRGIELHQPSSRRSEEFLISLKNDVTETSEYFLYTDRIGIKEPLRYNSVS